MRKIAKCPVCGEKPAELGRDSYGKIGISCCGATIWVKDNPVRWNQYATAMALTEAVVWADECEKQRDYMDDTTSNRDAWRSIVNLDLEANDKANDALDNALEVFKNSEEKEIR